MKFKVGDLVGSVAADSTKSRWTVTRMGCYKPDDGGMIVADARGNLYNIPKEHMQYMFLAHEMCDHDWKRLDLFRTTEFCCTKCSTTRPFDKERDAA